MRGDRNGERVERTGGCGGAAAAARALERAAELSRSESDKARRPEEYGRLVVDWITGASSLDPI